MARKDITRSIPVQFTKLKRLESLWLGECCILFIDFILFIYDKHLMYITLDNNRLTGSIPTLFEMDHLQDLGLSKFLTSENKKNSMSNSLN